MDNQPLASYLQERISGTYRERDRQVEAIVAGADARLDELGMSQEMFERVERQAAETKPHLIADFILQNIIPGVTMGTILEHLREFYTGEGFSFVGNESVTRQRVVFGMSKGDQIYGVNASYGRGLRILGVRVLDLSQEPVDFPHD